MTREVSQSIDFKLALSLSSYKLYALLPSKKNMSVLHPCILLLIIQLTFYQSLQDPMVNLLAKLKQGINVYEGISPSLLATMSLSVNIRGNTHIQLIQNMAKAGLIQDQAEINAFKSVDRQHFTAVKNPYQNKPYSISNRQSMTDIFTHSVIINNLSKHWRNGMNILDIGTGHGYLPFLIANILKNKGFSEYSIVGVDIHAEAIRYCQQLQLKLQGDPQRQLFKCCDLNDHLQTVEDGSLDVIIGGYYFQEKLSQRLTKKLTDNGVGIWPTRSQSGQALYKLSRNKQKVYLIETLFSMPVVRSEVSKYFVGEGEQQNVETTPVRQQKLQMSVQEIKSIRRQMEAKLREQLKVLTQKYRKADGRLLSLKQMRQNPEIKAKLSELQRLPKQKVKCGVK